SAENKKRNQINSKLKINSNNTPVSEITNVISNSDDISKQKEVLQNKDALASDVSNNVSNSDSLCEDAITSEPNNTSNPDISEDKEINEFLDLKSKERVTKSYKQKMLRNFCYESDDRQKNFLDSVIETKEHLSQERSESESPNYNIYVSEEPDEIEPTKS
ncbi:36492_t:CDS:2, partial [Gigaspora margarita]